MGTIQELNRQIDSLEKRKRQEVNKQDRKQALEEFVNEQMESKSVVRSYQDLGDLVREAAEESFKTLTDRKIAVRRVVSKLMHKYW